MSQQRFGGVLSHSAVDAEELGAGTARARRAGGRPICGRSRRPKEVMEVSPLKAPEQCGWLRDRYACRGRSCRACCPAARRPDKAKVKRVRRIDEVVKLGYRRG